MSLLAPATQPGGTNGSILRQRACPRVACATPTPRRGDSCCDDNCLIEVARRECNKEGSHGVAQNASESSTSRASNRQKAEVVDFKPQPCASHYQQTKDKYGAFLDNLGCICKILLSLNIDPCCAIPSHSPARSTGSKSSADTTMHKAGPASCEPKAAVSMQAPGECSKRGCCEINESNGIVSKDRTGNVPVEDEFKEECFMDEISERIANVPSEVAPPQSQEHLNISDSRVTKDLTEKVISDMDCSKGCCGESSPTTPASTSSSSQDIDPCSTKGCCGDVSLASSKGSAAIVKKALPTADRCCHIDTPLPPKNHVAPTADLDLCSVKRCCSSQLESAENSSPRVTKADASATANSNLCVGGCCGSQSIFPENLPPAIHKKLANMKGVVNSCALKACCVGQSNSATDVNGMERHAHLEIFDVESEHQGAGSRPCTQKIHNGFAANIPNTRNMTKKCCGDDSFCTSTAVEIFIPKSSPDTMDQGLDRLSINTHQSQGDDENCLHGPEHVLVRVQGMDCTGCEVKLHRSLQNLPELSNIKTSLLLAQAEFDMAPSKHTNMDNLFSIMEKMTGFTCTKITQSGVELEMVVDGNPKDFLRDWPSGVKDITALTKSTILVSYHPREIGARALISDPFFRRAQLARPTAPPLITSGRAHLMHTFYMTLLSVILTIPVLIFAWGPFSNHEVLYGAVSLSLATTVQTIVAGPFYTRTFNALIFSRMIDMDLLIVMSSSAAYIYSVIAYAYLAAGKPLETGDFFETSTLLVTLIMVGRTVSAFARQKAVESITIESLQATTALIVDEVTQQEKEIDARLLQYDDVFKVLPDMAIATDGVVISGESEVDESMVTGEATLIPKQRGMSMVAGSINHSGSLSVRVTRLPHENTIKTIGAMVDEAKSSKPKVQELADRIASYFVPLILALTAIVFGVWIAVGVTALHQNTSVSAIKAMTYAISVLIVSCPCAIGLAVPMVVVIAGGVAARHGLIFKTAETIDLGRKISHVIFDKTGTLTQGKLNVIAEEYLKSDRSSIASTILGLTTNSKHPVSKALATHLSTGDAQPLPVENIVSVAGNGITASYNGSIIRAGNPYWLNVQDHSSVRRILATGLTMFCVDFDNELVAIFGLEDLLRPDTVETIVELKRRKIEISIISGDNQAAVQSIATKLDIPLSNIRSRCSPERKQAYVKSLLAQDARHPRCLSHFFKRFRVHKKQSTILFVGDGTNDAPSLAQANIGLHMSEGGTDVAQSAADAILMRPSLKGILTLIDLSKAFHRRVVFNFAWSFVYNFAAILLAAGAFGKARIPPEFAGLGEVVSVVPVVGAAVGLRWWKG